MNIMYYWSMCICLPVKDHFLPLAAWQSFCYFVCLGSICFFVPYRYGSRPEVCILARNLYCRMYCLLRECAVESGHLTREKKLMQKSRLGAQGVRLALLYTSQTLLGGPKVGLALAKLMLCHFPEKLPATTCESPSCWQKKEHCPCRWELTCLDYSLQELWL